MTLTALAPTPETAAADTRPVRLSLRDVLARGEAAWENARGATRSPFMSWAWHRAWADADPDSAWSDVLALQECGASGALHALLPVRSRELRLHRMPVRALTWAIGDLGCPDHLDVLAAPGADTGALAPLLETLDWDVIILSNLAPDAPGVSRLAAALAARGHTVRLRPLWVCPYLDLQGGWEKYLAGLSARRRQAVRYMERTLRRDHAVVITDYDGDRLEEGWRHLVTLHEQRWSNDAGGERGALHDPRVVALHQRFIAELARRGELWLTTLDVDGQPAAAWYGFNSGDTVYFYQSGRDPSWERESVGQVMLATMIRRAAERGFARFDFLRGDDPYKRLWTTTHRRTEELTVFRRGWRGRWLRGLDALAALRARYRRRADG